MLHKWLVGLNFIHILPQQPQAIFKFHFFFENQIGQNKCWSSAFTLHRVHKHSPISYPFIDKSVRNSIEFRWILSDLVMNIYIEIFEILWSFGIFLATDIQNMRNTLFNQILSFKGWLVWTHVYPRKDLEQIDFF